MSIKTLVQEWNGVDSISISKVQRRLWWIVWDTLEGQATWYREGTKEGYGWYPQWSCYKKVFTITSVYGSLGMIPFKLSFSGITKGDIELIVSGRAYIFIMENPDAGFKTRNRKKYLMDEEREKEAVNFLNGLCDHIERVEENKRRK